MTSEVATAPEHADLKAELEARLQFETLLADLSAKLINLPAGEVDRQIEDAQRLVCESLGLDLSALWQWRSDNPRMLRLTHLYRPLGGPPVPDPLDAQEVFPWCQRQVLAGKTVAISSPADSPPEAARDREVWDHYGIKTNLTIPLSAGGGPFFGCVSFNDVKTERRWSGALVQRLQLVAQIFANALARKVADQALRESEARLGLAADAAGAGLWILHLQTNRFWVTQKTRELFHFPAEEEVTFDRFLGLVHPDDHELIRQTVQTMVQTKNEGQVEYRIIHPDGNVHWVLSRGRVRCLASGEPDSLMGVSVDITARKQAEAELLRNQVWLRSVIESTADGMLVVDLAGRVITWNSRFVELWRIPQELLDGGDDGVLLAQVVGQLSAPEAFLAKVRSLYASDAESKDEIPFKDGRVFERFSRPLVQQGALSGRVWSFRDITERKRAEEQVRQLSLALQQSPVSVIITNLQGEIIYVNPKFTEVSGYSLTECLGKTPRLLKSGETSPSTYQELWACITSGGTWRGEFHNRKKDGGLYWEWAVISPLLDATGRVTHFVGVKEDITARKQSEEALRTSQARLATAVDVAALGFYEMGSHPGEIFVDERLRSLLGLPPEEDHRAQEYWVEHIHPDDRERVVGLSRRVLGGELDQVAVEYRYLHPQRGTCWFSHVSRVQAHDPAGRPVRRLGVIRDITEQRRAELEAQELRNNLVHLTRVNSLGALSGSLAHELNQPLGIILSNAQAAQELLAQEPPDVAEVQAILTDIVAADRRAGDVIGRLRALLKRGQVSPQPLPLNQVIEEVLNLTRSDLIGRGVTVVCALAPDLPPIAGDRVQLQQLVLNLILNAAEAMAANAPGTRRLQLQTVFHQGRVRASVRDEGSGLPADVERLFQPFYTTKAQGLGMGLAICRSIMDAHQGRLWAEPHPERGAVFHFELPVAGNGERGARDEGRGGAV